MDKEFYYLGEKFSFENFSEKIDNIDEFYREKSKEIIPQIVDEYAKKMHLYPKSVKFRKNKRRFC